MFYFLAILLFIFAAFTFWFAIASFRENERRAGIVGVVAALVMAVVLAVYIWAWTEGALSGSTAEAAQLIIGVILALFVLSLFLPIGRRPEALFGTAGMKVGKAEQFNQKDTAFNIAHVGGYGAKLGKRRWALQSIDPFGGMFFALCMALRKQVDGNVNPTKADCPSTRTITEEIKKTAKYLGADLVGVTTVKEDFVYSDNFSYEDSPVGVGPAVTTPSDLKHKYIIVLGKEMSFDHIRHTLTEKNQDSVAEIGKTYYELAEISCALAAYIRQLGYPARAHHLRNEQVFLVPHAIDAGLGEQGRHNYLISAKYGPRVRLAGVTTTLELNEDKPVDIGVQHFCEICRLCERNCPSQSLAAEKALVRGYKKWPQDQESCFKFWVTSLNAYACTLCLKICPWNKPRTFVHKVSFFAASQSMVARRLLYWLAVIAYGKTIQWKRIPIPAEMDV